MRASLFSAALVASLVGFGSTLALVLAAAEAVGATPAQTTSWVLVVSLAKGLGSAGLSWWTRMPVVLAWSTAGAALVIQTEGVAMAEAAGAFVLAGLLIAVLGLVRPLGRLVALIPDAVASGMLAGILLPFCLALAPAFAEAPLLVAPTALTFAALRPRYPAWAVVAAMGVGLALAFGTGAADAPAVTGWPRPVVVPPAFDLGVAAGLALPLALVTMASQNLPGFATMRAAGYDPPVGLSLATTGLLSAGSALFGAHTVSQAAITAAICLGDDVHPDRAQRWRVGVVYGGMWVALALASPLVIAAIAALPAALVAGIVGLALLGPLMGALTGAVTAPTTRLAAVATLAVTASGVEAWDVGAAFWGLVAGLLLVAADRAATRAR